MYKEPSQGSVTKVLSALWHSTRICSAECIELSDQWIDKTDDEFQEEPAALR